MKTANIAVAGNVIKLQPNPPKRRGLRDRFVITTFTNPRTDSESWRVSGTKRDGTRVRENFSDPKAAQCRQVELTTEYLARESDTAIRATKLSAEQLRLAETAFIRLDADDELLSAVDFWLKNGRQHSASSKETPRIDEAVDKFNLWLEETESLRDRSKDFLRTQVGIFKNSIPNLRVADITPETIESFLETRKVSSQTKINSRLAVSRFFSWCMKGKDRRWVVVNPCKAVQVERDKRESLPGVLTVKECESILRVAEKYRRGRLVPYIAACMFGGCRPAEARRLTWDNVNLTDREIVIQSQASKTNKPRVVAIDDTLHAWLAAYKNKSFDPANCRRDLDAIKTRAGFVGRTNGEDPKSKKLKPWPQDVLRHTAISHFFRKTGSYGLAAEQFGNSEYIIKRHYNGRVSSEDTKAFYALLPKKGGRK